MLCAGIGLQNGADGSPFVSLVDAAGEAESAGVLLGSAVLSVSGVSVSGESGGMDVREVKGLMAQALRTGQPVRLELRAPVGSEPPPGSFAGVVEQDLVEDSPTGSDDESVADLEEVEVAPDDNEIVIDDDDAGAEEEEEEVDDGEEEDENDDYEESFEEVVDSEAEADIDAERIDRRETRRAVTPPPSASAYEAPAAAPVTAAVDTNAAAAQVEAAALLAAQRAEIEELRRANDAAEEQRREVARLSSTLQEVMQRLASTESTSGEGEARVESELAALRQSVTMLATEPPPPAHSTEETASPETSPHSQPLWGAPPGDDYSLAPRSGSRDRARSNERARSAERERLRARSAERDRLREQLHPKHGSSKKAWTYKKKHGYNPEVWNRLYSKPKQQSKGPAYVSGAWGSPAEKENATAQSNTSKVFSSNSGSSGPLSAYGGPSQAWDAPSQSGLSQFSDSTPPKQTGQRRKTSPYRGGSGGGGRGRRAVSSERQKRAGSRERLPHQRAGSSERQQRAGSNERQQRAGSNERHRRPPQTAGVSNTYPEPSAVPGPLWLSGLLDTDAADGGNEANLLTGLPSPLSPQSSVDRQPSLEAAMSGAAWHSDDYTNFLDQHPTDRPRGRSPGSTGGPKPGRRPLSSLSGARPSSAKERERERSYSDYGVYESPMAQDSSDEEVREGEEEGAESQHRRPLPPSPEGGGMEDQQRELIDVLRSQHLATREELGEQHPETVASLTQFVEHTTGMATMFLETGRGGEAWELLSDVHNAAKRQPMLLPAVQNSMACCLRRAGRLRAAESMLQKAATAVKGKGYPASVRGNTYLNLCAVLSSQGKHKGALAAAKQVRRIAYQFLPRH